MNKSFISILLTIAMVFASCMPAFGTETVTNEETAVTESAFDEGASEIEASEIEETEEAAVEETKSEETESNEELVTEETVAEENGTEESETASTETGAAVSEEELTVEAASEAVQKESAAAEADEVDTDTADADTDEEVVISDVEIELDSYQPDDDTSCDDMFAAYVDDAFGITEFSDGKLKGKTIKAGSKLTDADLIIYNSISEVLPSIASGEETSTVFNVTAKTLGYDRTGWTADELGVEAIYSDGSLVSEAATAAVSKFYSDIVTYDLSKIIDALLADYPYLLYWFDKTTGVFPSCNIAVTLKNEVYRCYVKSINLKFTVAEEFASSEDYTVDSDTGESVQTAVENASSIVSKYSGSQDFDILEAYCDEICDLTSYNSEAISEDWSYGNPWQLIWAFDGDDSTEVVCEGYSKAFKYLCDKTEFSAEIGCTTVTGSIPAGGHMWNIVNMDDDCNYLVDVTNIDSAGYDLFLVGTEGSVDSGYTFCGMKYVYDEEMTELWDTEDLTLKVHDYGAHECSNWTVISESTCIENGIKQGTCDLCGDSLEEELELADHTWGSDYEVDVEASCVNEGSKSIHCTVCGASDESTSRVIEKTAHTYGDWTVTEEATCIEEGSREKVCTVCGDKVTEVIPATGIHTWEEEYTVDQEPTFTSEGSQSIHCAVCGAIDETTVQTIPVLEEGWYEEESGWRYYYSDGTYPTSSFVTIENDVYYFNESGYRVMGWQTIGENKYYFKTTGPMHIGWLKVGGYYYYFKTNGVMLTGWLKKSGKMYYFKVNGQRLTGWLKKGGKYFYFKTNGEMLTGWLKKSGKMYFFKTNGQRHTGWLKKSGKYYYFNPSNGQMVTGRYKIGSKWFTFNSNGVRQ